MARLGHALDAGAAEDVNHVGFDERIFGVKQMTEGEEQLPPTQREGDDDNQKCKPCFQSRTTPAPSKTRNEGREGKCKTKLAFNQTYVTSSRPLAGLFVGEFDPLPLAKQLEHRPSHRAAVEEVFDAGFITNESEPFIDQQSCDRARHTLLR